KPLAPREKRNDSVSRVYKTIRRRSPGFTWTPKAVRQFGSTLLRESDQWGQDRYVEPYLGRSPKGTTDGHYARQGQALFDQAILWLGSRLGLAPDDGVTEAPRQRTTRS